MGSVSTPKEKPEPRYVPETVKSRALHPAQGLNVFETKPNVSKRIDGCEVKQERPGRKQMISGQQKAPK